MTSWAAFIFYGTVLAVALGELGAWWRRRKHRKLRERIGWYLNERARWHDYPDGVTSLDVQELYHRHPPTLRRSMHHAAASFKKLTDAIGGDHATR